MYSEEIKRLLLIKRNLVSISEYFQICSSEQVDHIKNEDGLFKIWTKDNCYFELRIGGKK